MNRNSAGLLMLLAAIWGGSFFFIRLAVGALGPWLLVEVRVAVAALVLGVVVLLGRGHFVVRTHWRQFLILGIFNAALPFTLIAFAELRLTASYGAILNATTPMFSVIIAALWLHDPISLKKVGGLLMGVIGVAILVGLTAQQFDPLVLLSVGASLAGALSYGFGGIYAARNFRGVPPLQLSLGQQASAALVLLPFAVTHLPNSTPSLAVVGAVLGLGVLCTALAYLLYFRLIAQVGATNTLVVTLLVPVFGILWGAALLHESITLATVAGAVTIFASVVLVTNMTLRAKRQGAVAIEGTTEE
ncbi:MAG: DMT family transporter [Ktedonobacterales bacterium]|nr:DMT family transporter [Ktedonobacterales bacterium]